MNTTNLTNANAATDMTQRNVDCGESTPLSLLPPSLPPAHSPELQTAGSSGSGPARSSENPNPANISTSCSEKIRGPQSPIRNRVIDTWDIPFPKTLAELNVLDATREIPYLKALCNRRQIHTPGKTPTPAQIIPIIQARLDHHLTLKPKGLSEIADIMVEWKLIHDDLAEFLTQLKNLCPPSSALSVSCSVLIPKPANTPYPSRQA